MIDISDSYLLSFGLGWFISFCYISTGFILFLKAIKIKSKSFGKMVTISVFSRLLFAIAGITLSVKIFDINSTIFIVTLFSFYFVFQIIEVVGLKNISIKGA